MSFSRIVLLTFALWTLGSSSHAQVASPIKDVSSVTVLDPSRLEPGVILFSDHGRDELADAGTGLIRFDDWGQKRPVEKQFLDLYPTYVEPTVNVTLHGITKPHQERLYMYVAEARFLAAKSPGSFDLSRYATLPFLNRMDPAITHRLISAAEATPNTDPENAFNRRPERKWCETPARSICVQSRYDLEGKLPLGVRLANKLEEGGKKISEFVEFQSELRMLGPQELDQVGLAKLTGFQAPVVGALEQNIFHVNQIMRFGKLLAVFQPHPTDPNKTVVTAFMALAVKASVLERKKDYEKVPVMRNLVPAQVLMGNSSFNIGSSISAGLPRYVRNQLVAIKSALERD